MHLLQGKKTVIKAIFIVCHKGNIPLLFSLAGLKQHPEMKAFNTITTFVAAW